MGRGPVDPGELGKVRRPLDRAATLPGALFSDPAVYARELERLVLPAWQGLGRVDEIAAAGDFLTFEIGGSGVVIVRGSDGELRAFHNVCRHRGTRLVEPASGGGLAQIQCPYHAWTYDLAGRLVAAPMMTGIKEFDRGESGLLPVQLEAWRGFVFVNLDPKAAPLATYLGGLVRRAVPYPLERLRRARRIVYDIAANWKLAVQSSTECFQAPGVHPQLARLTSTPSGQEDLTDGPVFGGWSALLDGAQSLTALGTTRRKPFAGLSPEDRRRLYHYVLFPSNVISLLPDYVTFGWFLPLGPDRTRLVFDIYVDQDEADPADDATELWETMNRQDAHLCELAHLGLRSVAYHQGRYSSNEEVVHLLDEYYLEQMGLLRRGR
jgi:phenylpropionate dioxygenase-like ring-hydroxylating dioxygenase large terminal subunit